jgi:uncharacterized protein YbgA (DUF1722 family)/uncharacterized protein YbbK (DUF523 family)
MGGKIKIGISACLRGEKVRYDGGHKWERWLTGTLGPYIDFAPVCPEVECGLGVPREIMRLEGDPAAPRLLTVKTREERTERLLRWTEKRLAALAQEGLWGFIFKSNSPSCGPAGVKVYDARGAAWKRGAGLFAAAFMARFPLLPVADEARLADPQLRENFVTRIFVLQRWREMLAKSWTSSGLVAFHTRHKLLLLAHSPRHYRLLGRLTARAGEIPGKELAGQYQALLLEALGIAPTDKKQANVLQHVLGYFKKQLSAEEKRELLEMIEAYRLGDLPLLPALTLLQHYALKYGESYLQEQYYLRPQPLELLLRNHA